LKWETFHQYQSLAEQLAARIDDRLRRLTDAEEARPFTDYAFLNVAGDPDASFPRSPSFHRPPDCPVWSAIFRSMPRAGSAHPCCPRPA